MKININDHVYYALNGVCKVTNIQKLKLENEVKDYILNILKEDLILFYFLLKLFKSTNSK